MLQKLEKDEAELQRAISALREVNPEMTDQLLSHLGPKKSSKQEWDAKRASLFVTNNTSRLAKIFRVVSDTKKTSDKSAKVSERLKNLRAVQQVPGPAPKI